MVILSGKATIPASAPGVVPSLDVAVSGMTTDGSVLLTLAERGSGTDVRGQMEFYGVAGSDSITIYGEENELTTDTDVYWLVDTTSKSVSTPQTLTGAGAVNLTTEITLLVTTGSDALTLADGAEGQRKFIMMKTDGGDGTLTPTNFGNGTTIVFSNVGDTAELIFTNSSWYYVGGTATIDSNLTGGKITIEDVQDGGAANGSLIKKTLQPGEAYTTTTAGLMVKNYGDATATVPSGEFTGLYINLKGLHVDPGNNTSLISAHVHASNTTTVHAGLWLYGDLTNGIKASGSTVTNMIDVSEATAVTNLISLPAAGTDPVIANALVPATAPDAGTMGADACVRVLVNSVAYYIPLYDTLHA